LLQSLFFLLLSVGSWLVSGHLIPTSRGSEDLQVVLKIEWQHSYVRTYGTHKVCTSKYKYWYSRESLIRSSVIRMNQLSKHQKSNCSTWKPGQFLDHTSSFVTYNTIFNGVQLSEHFTYPNTPCSQRVRITDFLL